MQPQIGQVYKIDPPPEGIHPSEAAAEDVILKWTLSRHFNVSRQKVERNKNGDIRTRLSACDRSGEPKNTRHLREGDRVRTMRGSKRMGCPMRIKIVAVDENNTEGPWKIAHTRDESTKHNHPTSLDVRVHVGHRQRSSQQSTAPEVSTVNDFIFFYQMAAGVSVSKVYTTLLLTDTSSLFIPKDIANVKDAKRRNLLATDTVIEALFRKLTEHGFHFKYEVNEDSRRLKYLLWAHPETLKLAQHYMGVEVVDCTYKTNKHNWPLCNIIVLTGLNNVLPLAQCWLPGEAELNYTWRSLNLSHYSETILSRYPAFCNRSRPGVYEWK
ncbi:hypothetical protein AM588_10002643 [Phytophthora nicotianae]|uniref:FAR1 domain-containing protein n=1 Tax=Phytophthora nicotianae TaxID=4792 RepID=A0A0W8D213_PHYNI|nr:hypothetical protein AM588_10002643 [Phytophthora nicotianae]